MTHYLDKKFQLVTFKRIFRDFVERNPQKAQGEMTKHVW